MSSEGEGVSAAGGERRGPGERAARDAGVSPITGVLVATDLQSDSRSVVGAAAAVARLTRAPLHVVHVFTPAAVPPRCARATPRARTT
jgi:K+-sensing histidine kinase KdpD